MKKAFPALLLFAIFVVHNSVAQPKNATVKNQDKAIIISVKGIEYDDPAFEDLRKSVKGNMKVKQANPAFTGDVAKISLQYRGNAAELWDELPQTCKQNFKVTAIDDNKIDLQLKTTTKQTTAAVTETKKEDCIDCYYYKSCGFDTSVTWNGNTYKGYKKKAGLYDCKNGALISVFTSSDKKTYAQTIFKTNEPAGSSWVDSIGANAVVKHVTISKGLAISYGTGTYDDVIIVYSDYGYLKANYYYAKERGFIKYDSVDKDFNPAVAATLKGTVDQSLAGLWRNYNPLNKTNTYYKLDGDGSFAYYSGMVNKDYQMPPGISYWRVNGNSLELYNGTWGNVSKVPFQKKNDPASGKPAIVFGSGDTSIYFVADDGKAAWK